jgi:hypothetical protein
VDFDPRTMQVSNNATSSRAARPDGGVIGWEDATWSGTDPNVIYGHTNLNLWSYNVQTTQYTLVKNFGAELPPGHLRQMSKSADDQVFGFTTQDTGYAQTGSIAWRRNTNQVVLQLGDPRTPTRFRSIRRPLRDGLARGAGHRCDSDHDLGRANPYEHRPDRRRA